VFGDSRKGAGRIRTARHADGESAVWRHRARSLSGLRPISTVDAEEAARTYELLEQMDQLTELEAPVVEEIAARKRA